MLSLHIFGILLSLILILQDNNTAASRCEGRKADVVFIIDSSTSIWPKDFTKQKQFIRNIVKKLDIGTDKVHVGSVSFSDKIRLDFGLTQFKDTKSVEAAILTVDQIYGETHTGDAIKLAKDRVFNKANGGRPKEVPQIGIVITDGNSQDGEWTKKSADAAKKAGILMFAIGVGKKISEEELGNIASGPQNVFKADNYTRLVTDLKLLESITRGACQNDVPCGGKGADIVWVSDTTNADLEGFTSTADFIRTVTAGFTIGKDHILVGSLASTCLALPTFNLNKYTTKEPLLLAFEVKTIGNLGGLFKTLVEESFDASNGGREGKKKVAVVVTDTKKYDQKSVEAALKARNDKVEIFVIGVGADVDQNTVEGIASLPHDKHIIYVDNYGELKKKQAVLLQYLCKLGI